jgi:hypothetical protein
MLQLHSDPRLLLFLRKSSKAPDPVRGVGHLTIQA